MKSKYPTRRLAHSGMTNGTGASKNSEEDTSFETEGRTSDQSHNTSNEIADRESRSRSVSSSPTKKAVRKGKSGRKPGNEHKVPFVHKSTVFVSHRVF